MYQLESLPWLVKPAENFRQQLKALDLESSILPSLVELSKLRLDEGQLSALGKSILRNIQRIKEPSTLSQFRLGILSNGNTELLRPVLTASAVRYGLLTSVQTADFGQVAEPVFACTSMFLESKPDAVLLALDERGLPLKPCPGEADKALVSLDEAITYLERLATALASRGVQAVILQTLPRQPMPLFGSLDTALPGTALWMATEFNRRLTSLCASRGYYLFDVAALAEAVGGWHWHDARHWQIAKLAFSPRILPLWADHLSRLLAALRGKSRKCLVLDLDNTLWGGVIGDDGLAGIVLGNGSPDGEAYLTIQQTALMLHSRGIILAVNSKNDDLMARRPFLEHPDMLLKLEDISVFIANWQDKASNCITIASRLNLGLDALVLLDDNPAERDLVRRRLPDVAVPELPDDPSLFPYFLLNAGHFESVAFTSDDRARTASYQSVALHAALLADAGDYDGFLTSLGMQADSRPFQACDIQRIAQLVNKTNQFNLTTRRYSPAQVEAFLQDPSILTLQVRLRDRFADHGLIGAVICRRSGEDLEIDTWLMSCRVLKRRVEEYVLNVLVDAARASGARCLIGVYQPTERNLLVAGHYLNLGFDSQPIQDNDKGTRWRLSLQDFKPVSLPIVPVEF